MGQLQRHSPQQQFEYGEGVLQSVHFKNFRCLRDTQLNLTPLTVLVGANASGKSAVLEGLRSHLEGSHAIQSLALDPVALRGENSLAAAHQLSRTGDNLTNVFATLTRRQRAAIAHELCQWVPPFSDVDREATQQGRHRLCFQDRWAPDRWLTPSQVSDGTMLVLAFLVLPYQALAPDLLTLEEPERALHPYLLEELLRLLRKLTTGELGQKPVQVVLATHSAQVLESFRPEEVRFLTRSPEEGAVQVHEARTDSTHWQQVYQEHCGSLGSLWLSGSLGGVSGR